MGLSAIYPYSTVLKYIMRFQDCFEDLAYMLVKTKLKFMVTGRGAERFSLGSFFSAYLFSLHPFIDAYIIEPLLPSSLSICLEF